MSEDQALTKIDEVLCDTGESSPMIEVGQPLQSLRSCGDHMLEHAYLNNVTVVRAGDKFYLGEFSYRVVEVSEADARQIAADFGQDEDEEDSDG